MLTNLWQLRVSTLNQLFDFQTPNILFFENFEIKLHYLNLTKSNRKICSTLKSLNRVFQFWITSYFWVWDFFWMGQCLLEFRICRILNYVGESITRWIVIEKNYDTGRPHKLARWAGSYKKRPAHTLIACSSSHLKKLTVRWKDSSVKRCIRKRNCLLRPWLNHLRISPFRK